MKKINFLLELKLEDKLKIVDPNEEVAQAYKEKAKNSFLSAKILIENNQIEDAVSLIYYSMYHQLISLLFKVGIKSENHAASIIILKELFNLDNSKISFAKTERVEKQYYVDFDISKEEVKDMLVSAEEFNANLREFTERMTTKEIQRIHQEFIASFEQ